MDIGLKLKIFPYKKSIGQNTQLFVAVEYRNVMCECRSNKGGIQKVSAGACLLNNCEGLVVVLVMKGREMKLCVLVFPDLG